MLKLYFIGLENIMEAIHTTMHVPNCK